MPMWAISMCVCVEQTPLESEKDFVGYCQYHCTCMSTSLPPTSANLPHPTPSNRRWVSLMPWT